MNAGHDMSAWDAFAKDYVTWVEPHTSRNVLQLLDQLHLGVAGSLMEVGCASGLAAALYTTQLGEGWSVALVDGSAAMVRLARGRLGPAVQVQQGFLTNLPCVNSGMDAILAHLVPMFPADVDAAASECARVLRPGGRLGLTVPGRLERSSLAAMIGAAQERLGMSPPSASTTSPPPPTPEILIRALSRVGFSELAWWWDRLVFRLPSPEDYGAMIQHSGGARRAWFDGLSTDLRTRVVEEVVKLAAEQLRAGQVPADEILGITATRELAQAKSVRVG